MRKKYAAAAVAILMCLTLAACYIELEAPPLRGGWGYPDLFTGTVYGSGRGYGAGGVRVTVDLEYGFIVDVDFDLRSETAMFVRGLPDRLLPIILQSNSFNFPDTVGGATVTNMGIKAAAREAMLKIPNVTEADLDF